MLKNNKNNNNKKQRNVEQNVTSFGHQHSSALAGSYTLLTGLNLLQNIDES